MPGLNPGAAWRRAISTARCGWAAPFPVDLSRPKGRTDRAVLDRDRAAHPQEADRTPDRGAEGLCRQPVPERAGLRHRPCGHRQDLSGRGGRGDDVHLGRGGEDHPVAPGGGSGRTAGLPARRHEGKGRSLHAAALRRAERFPAVETGGKADPGKADRDRAPGLHARAARCRMPSSCWTRRRTPPQCR